MNPTTQGEDFEAEQRRKAVVEAATLPVDIAMRWADAIGSDHANVEPFTLFGIDVPKEATKTFVQLRQADGYVVVGRVIDEAEPADAKAARLLNAIQHAPSDIGRLLWIVQQQQIEIRELRKAIDDLRRRGAAGSN